jgi:hypothetical protein
VNFYMSFIDGMVWFAVDGSNKMWARRTAADVRSGVLKWTPGFHLIEVMMTGQRANDRINIGMALCKTSDPSSCGSIVPIKPVMTWPPVCGDAVKYAYTSTKADIGDLGVQM